MEEKNQKNKIEKESDKQGLLSSDDENKQSLFSSDENKQGLSAPLKEDQEKDQKENAEVEFIEDKEIEEMFEAGLHFGHRHSRVHPKMLPFLYGTRNNIDIIDLLKTKEYLKKALDYLKQKKKENPLILFVGTKGAAGDLIKTLAEKIEMPYVNERWLGGTLTNFEVVKKRVDYLKTMEEKKARGELDKYLKKERVKIDKDLNRIRRKMEGLKRLSRLPDILFAVDVAEEKLAITEAKKRGVTIVGICDTNGDQTSIDYPIPANDDTVSSLKYILERVENALS